MHIPEKIYLQIDDDDDIFLEGTTWCQDRINDSDIEYIRTDLVRIKEKKNKDIKI